MKRLADGLYQLQAHVVPHAINAYLMGGVLVDAGTRRAGRCLLRQLRGYDVVAHALTHAHPDHQGSSHMVCETLGIPLWCGAQDADAVEDPELILQRMPEHWSKRYGRSWIGPAHPVARLLRAGDEVGGFTVLETPGHTRGHIAFWRAADRTLVLGDVLINPTLWSRYPHPREPIRVFTADPAENRRSIRKLAALEPELACFGHGPPLHAPRALARLVAALPE